MNTPSEKAREVLAEAKQELGIFVGSHFRNVMFVTLNINDLTTMSGEVKYPGGVVTTINGFMIGDTDWQFDVPQVEYHSGQTVYIPVETLEDYIDDIETAEGDLLNFIGNEDDFNDG